MTNGSSASLQAVKSQFSVSKKINTVHKYHHTERNARNVDTHTHIWGSIPEAKSGWPKGLIKITIQSVFFFFFLTNTCYLVEVIYWFVLAECKRRHGFFNRLSIKILRTLTKKNNNKQTTALLYRDISLVRLVCSEQADALVEMVEKTRLRIGTRNCTSLNITRT